MYVEDNSYLNELIVVRKYICAHRKWNTWDAKCYEAGEGGKHHIQSRVFRKGLLVIILISG